MTRSRNDPAPRRWLAITAVRIAAAVGAVLGLVLLARAPTLPPRILGIAWTLASLWLMTTVPAALARRWRSGA